MKELRRGDGYRIRLGVNGFEGSSAGTFVYVKKHKIGGRGMRHIIRELRGVQESIEQTLYGGRIITEQ